MVLVPGRPAERLISAVLAGAIALTGGRGRSRVTVIRFSREHCSALQGGFDLFRISNSYLTYYLGHLSSALTFHILTIFHLFSIFATRHVRSKTKPVTCYFGCQFPHLYCVGSDDMQQGSPEHPSCAGYTTFFPSHLVDCTSPSRIDVQCLYTSKL